MIHYQPGEDDINGFIATGTALLISGIAAAAASSTASAIAAKKQSQTAKEVAQIQTSSSDKALEAQTQSNREALDFQKQQAAQDLITHNATAKANYDQWAAREKRISSLGAALGLAPRDIPAFVPTPGQTDAPVSNPGNSGVATPGLASGGLSAPGPNASPDDVGHFVASYFASKGVKPQATSVEYFVQKWPELVARGQELGDPDYPMKRLAAADEFGGGGAAGGTVASAAKAPWSQYQQTQNGPITPMLQAPQIGTLASYARG